MNEYVGKGAEAATEGSHEVRLDSEAPLLHLARKVPDLPAIAFHFGSARVTGCERIRLHGDGALNRLRVLRPYLLCPMLNSSASGVHADEAVAGDGLISNALPAATSSPAASVAERQARRKRWRPFTAWILTLRPTLFFLLLGAVIVLISFQLDEASFAFFYKNNPLHPDTGLVADEMAGWRDYLPEAASFFGDWWGLMVGCALALVIVLKWRPVRWRYIVRVIVAMMLTSTIAGALCNGVRMISCRARPTSQVEPGFYPLYNGKERAILRHAYSSFPSGHAATAGGLFTLALILNWQLGLVMFAIPVIVSWSRLYFGVHHMSDVVTSQVAAFFVAAWVWTYLMPWLRTQYTLWWCKRRPLSGAGR